MWRGTVSFTKNSKYNYHDMNRSNENIEYLEGLLRNHGYNPQNMKPTPTDYTVLDFPTVSGINNIRANIQSFISCSFKPIAPEAYVDIRRKQGFDYRKANAIEQNLQKFYEGIDLMVKGFKYSGTFEAGQDIVL